MKYTIQEFNESVGQIVVEFENGIRLAVDLPLDTLNRFPEGAELEALVMSHYPTWHVERMEKIAGGVQNAQYIRDAVVKKETIEANPDSTLAINVRDQQPLSLEESEQMQIEAFEGIVLKVLKTRGLIDA